MQYVEWAGTRWKAEPDSVRARYNSQATPRPDRPAAPDANVTVDWALSAADMRVHDVAVNSEDAQVETKLVRDAGEVELQPGAELQVGDVIKVRVSDVDTPVLVTLRLV
jgi:hypothetical protein